MNSHRGTSRRPDRDSLPERLDSTALKAAALACGFDLCGLARAEALDPAPLGRFLEQGYGADMEWMGRRLESRLDPRRTVGGDGTVIALACAYSRPDEEASGSLIARYARGRDYHYTLRDRLRALRRRILEMDAATETYACVDTGLIMEKAWAQRAGLGWIGKNGCLINKRLGSWLVLCAMVIDRAADRYDAPHEELCGDCRFCLDACPTAAFPSPGIVDSRRCLSYHSIENRGVVPEDLRRGFSGRAFGCDVCQDVCPWNRSGAHGGDRFTARPVARLSARELASLSEEEFRQATRGTAIARAQYDGLRRNALYALGASKDLQGAEVARRLTVDPSPIVRDAAAWALRQLNEPPATPSPD
jgi:epoxyqueuosine reductase